MIRALWTAATGMVAQQQNIDIISNNLANVNSTGFKKSRADFQDLLYSTIRAAGTEAGGGMQIPTGIQIGNGTRLAATNRMFTQGDYMNTENPLDLIIEGDGFLQVLRPNGDLAYTKNGALKVDSDGRLVTSDGYPIQPEISIPTDAIEVTIGVDGTVTILQSGVPAPQNLGSLSVALFANPAGLRAIGQSMFEETSASGSPTTVTPGENGSGNLLQGFLEMSNVKVVEEMINMISGQRAYEINAKTITTADEMLQKVTQLKR